MRPVGLRPEVDGVVIRVRAGRVRDGERVLLEGIDVELAGGRLLVVLGPGGVGKSTLARVLAGAHPSHWQIEGEWRSLPDPGDGNGAARGSVFVEQPGRQAPGGAALLDGSPLVGALSASPRAVILDEPRPPIEPPQRERWLRALRGARSSGAAILLVTHDLALAAELADQVVLLYGGKIVARGEAPEFFERPPNELARQFLRQGNCSLAPSPPSLPSHFRWIEPGRLAGMGRPGLLGDPELDLEAIAAAGVRRLVTLTRTQPPLAEARSVGIACCHLPIPDMGAPSLAQAATVVRDVVRWTGDGEAVAVHCHAGLGRTGLLLASVLIWRGASAAAALLRLRSICSGYVQSFAQERFLERFEEAYGSRPEEAGGL